MRVRVSPQVLNPGLVERNTRRLQVAVLRHASSNLATGTIPSCWKGIQGRLKPDCREALRVRLAPGGLCLSSSVREQRTRNAQVVSLILTSGSMPFATELRQRLLIAATQGSTPWKGAQRSREKAMQIVATTATAPTMYQAET